MSALTSLIARIEAGETGREVDRLIVLALYSGAWVSEYCAGDEEWIVLGAEPFINWKAPLPKFTTSLDAALSLVPEGCGWEAWNTTVEPPHVWFTVYNGHGRWTGNAATPALALCLAALRARAAQEKEE